MLTPLRRAVVEQRGAGDGPAFRRRMAGGRGAGGRPSGPSPHTRVRVRGAWRSNRGKGRQAGRGPLCRCSRRPSVCRSLQEAQARPAAPWETPVSHRSRGCFRGVGGEAPHTPAPWDASTPLPRHHTSDPGSAKLGPGRLPGDSWTPEGAAVTQGGSGLRTGPKDGTGVGDRGQGRDSADEGRSL